MINDHKRNDFRIICTVSSKLVECQFSISSLELHVTVKINHVGAPCLMLIISACTN